MGKIVAIGGGEIGRPGYPIETTKIDREIIISSGKEKPTLCFLPTASNDSELYIQTVMEHFGKRLGCTVTWIELLRKRHSYTELEERVLSSDIIYVGGGNTKTMLEAWQKASLDGILVKAFEKNIVLSGISAGAMCWFKYGSSDAIVSTASHAPFIGMPCLNLIGLSLCPHFDVEKYRRPGFQYLLRETDTNGIGLDNCAAIKIEDDRFEIITSKNGARAWFCRWLKGEYAEIALEEGASHDIDYLLGGMLNAKQ
jgi:dipeptidase E